MAHRERMTEELKILWDAFRRRAWEVFNGLYNFGLMLARMILRQFFGWDDKRK